MRDDFDEKTKEILARRAGFRCSNPKCRKLTTGPQANPARTINIGVAAHIAAASPGGKRYDPIKHQKRGNLSVMEYGFVSLVPNSLIAMM